MRHQRKAAMMPRGQKVRGSTWSTTSRTKTSHPVDSSLQMEPWPWFDLEADLIWGHRIDICLTNQFLSLIRGEQSRVPLAEVHPIRTWTSVDADLEPRSKCGFQSQPNAKSINVTGDGPKRLGRNKKPRCTNGSAWQLNNQVAYGLGFTAVQSLK